MTPIKHIQQATADYYHITVADILGPSRQRVFVEPRQMAMLLARKHTGRSFPEIGRAFRRDHTTVLNNCTAVIERKGDQSDDGLHIMDAARALHEAEREARATWVFRSRRNTPKFTTRQAA